MSVRLVELGGKQVAGFAGLASCGRVWLCPVCNAKVMATRAVEIGAALTWAVVEGLQVVWGSLTVRHNAFTSLRRLIEIERDAWRYMVRQGFWQRSNATKGIPHAHVDRCDPECDRKIDTIDLGGRGRVGYIRAAELTIGDNGWHPHFHPIVLLRMTADAAQAYADRMVDAWVEGVHRAGGEARAQGGQQLRVLRGVEVYDELASYVTKSTYDTARSSAGLSKLALETVWSQSKNARGRAKGTRSHWTLLADIEAGLYDEAQRWLQLEAEIEGHRMITWSRGLRNLAGLNTEKDDEEIAAEEIGSQDDTVAVITPNGWRQIRDLPAVLTLVLDTLERTGPVGLAAVLDAHGVEWTTFADLADVQNAYVDDEWVDQMPQGPANRARSKDDDGSVWSPNWYGRQNSPV